MLFLFCMAFWFLLLVVSSWVLPGPFFPCFSVLLALWAPRLGKRELVCVFLMPLFVLPTLIFVHFLFLLVSRVSCDRCTPWTCLLIFFSLVVFMCWLFSICTNVIRRVSSHFVASHFVYSHFVYSHLVCSHFVCSTILSTPISSTHADCMEFVWVKIMGVHKVKREIIHKFQPDDI